MLVDVQIDQAHHHFHLSCLEAYGFAYIFDGIKLCMSEPETRHAIKIAISFTTFYIEKCAEIQKFSHADSSAYPKK